MLCNSWSGGKRKKSWHRSIAYNFFFGLLKGWRSVRPPQNGVQRQALGDKWSRNYHPFIEALECNAGWFNRDILVHSQRPLYSTGCHRDFCHVASCTTALLMLFSSAVLSSVCASNCSRVHEESRQKEKCQNEIGMFITNAFSRHLPATEIPFTGASESFRHTNQK